MISTVIPQAALSNWGLAAAIFVMFVLLAFVSWVILVGTRTHMVWRERVEQGDVDAIQMLVSEEIERWKTSRMPKGTDPAVWHGVQSAELLEVAPASVRISAVAEGQYALVSGERREISNAFQEAMKLTSKLADMLLYDVPSVRLPGVQIDVYSTYRDEEGSAQRCIMTTTCDRAVAAALDWDETPAEDIVRAFGGRYRLDDRGNALPIEVEAPAPNSVPAAFYEEEA